MVLLGSDVMRETELTCEVGLVEGCEKVFSRIGRKWSRLGLIKLGREVGPCRLPMKFAFMM